MRRTRLLLCVVLTFIVFSHSVYAAGQDYIPLTSPSVLLMEQTTGKVLYAKNERVRMYPASMTKILTALVAMDYLAADDVITVGAEIYGLPADYNTAIHFEGETITVRNLLRVLMIRSGNETGCILALNAVRVKENRQNIPYAEAERQFNLMMNEKARMLGAMESNFTNPYGLHDVNHYTTAYDMALISRAYMENSQLRQIAAERAYVGDSLDGHVIDGAKTQNYSFENHNELLLGGANAYAYATGVKTGFTDEAGQCVTASASKNGMELIAVVFNSPDPGRWQDARILFDYGFESYAFDTIHKRDDILTRVTIANAQLGDLGYLDALADGDASALLSKDEKERLVRNITFDTAYRAQGAEVLDAEYPDILNAPIEQDTILGTISYVLDGVTIYEGTFRAAATAEERTFDSDVDYYVATFKANVFTIKALPYWFGGAGLLIGIIGIAVAVAGRRSRRRDRWSYGGRHRGYR